MIYRTAVYQSTIPVSSYKLLNKLVLNLHASVCVGGLFSSGHPSMLSVNASSLSTNSSPSQTPLSGQSLPDEQGKKREIRLMKNRCALFCFVDLKVIFVLPHY